MTFFQHPLNRVILSIEQTIKTMYFKADCPIINEVFAKKQMFHSQNALEQKYFNLACETS